MKKFLLSLAAVALCTTSLYAEGYTIEFTKTTSADGNGITANSTKVSEAVTTESASFVTGTFTTASSVSMKAKNGLKFGASSKTGTVAFAVSESGKILASGFKIKHAVYGTDTNETIKVTFNKGTAEETVKTTAGISSADLVEEEFSFDSPITISTIEMLSGNTGTGKTRGYVGSIEIIEANDDINVIQSPTISFTDNTVTLTANENNDAIYYTIDGTDPKEEGATLYDGNPFTVNRGTTVKAVSKDAEGNFSKVVSEVITWTLKVNSLNDFLTNEEYQSDEVIFDFPVIAIYQNGNNLYITDNSDYVLVYGSLGQTYSNGDVIPAGFKGKYKDYNGLIEIETPSNFGEATAGEPIEAKEITIDQLASLQQSTYVKIKNATISDYSSKNGTIKDEDGNSAAVYDTHSLNLTGKKDYTGFVGCYKTTVQFIPVAAVACVEDIVAPEAITVEGADVEDGEMLIEDGTTLTFKSVGATKMVISDKESEEVIASSDSDSIEFTPENDCEITVTASNEKGTETADYTILVVHTLGNLTVNDVEYENEAIIDGQINKEIKFYAKNAESINVEIVGNDDEVEETIEGDSYTWTPTIAGEYMAEFTVKGEGEEATYNYTIEVAEGPKPWIRVKHQGEIVEDVKYAVVGYGKNSSNNVFSYTVGGYNNSNSSKPFFNVANVTLNEAEEIESLPESTTYFSFEDASEGNYFIKSQVGETEKYLNCVSSGNYAKFVDISETNQEKKSIKFMDDESVLISHEVNSTETRYFVCNPSSGTERFSFYAKYPSTSEPASKPVYLYYQEGSQATMSHVHDADGKPITEKKFSVGEKLYLSVRKGHDAYWKFTPADAPAAVRAANSHTPDEGYELYDAENGIELTQAGTISHYTVTGDKASTVNTLNILPDTSTGVATIAAEDGEAVYFDLQGRRLQGAPEQGIYLVRTGNKVEKAVK